MFRKIFNNRFGQLAIRNFIFTTKKHLHIRSNSGSPGYELPPLTKSIEKLAKVKYQVVDSKLYETSVTTINNGLRIASEKLYGDFCTVGVIIDAGPRYETPFVNGITHFLEKLAFSSCTAYETRDKILLTLEKYGAICDCQSGRDVIIYALSGRRDGLPEILNLLAETVYRPNFLDEELNHAKQTIEFEVDELLMKADLEPVLNEMIHSAAYQNKTLGNPKYCPKENMEKINKRAIYSFMKSNFKPQNMVLACVGVDHNEFVKMAKENFGNKLPIWEENKNLCDDIQVNKSKAEWIGGGLVIEKELFNPFQNELPDLAHLVVGLESPAFNDEKNFVASCILNMIMGGGGSFSAGGPGKGMYSRLYLNVLNRYHFMFNATAYNQSYLDSGLFAIHASAPPSNMEDMCKIISQELVKMSGPIEKEELSRAKRQLQSMLFMNLEQRPVQFEDVARQILFRNKRENPKYYFDYIDSIQETDIRNVADMMLSSKPAVAALGKIGSNKPYELIQKMINKEQSKLKRIFSLM